MNHLLEALREQKEISAIMISLFTVALLNFLFTVKKWKSKTTNYWSMGQVKFSLYVLIGAFGLSFWMFIWILGYVS